MDKPAVDQSKQEEQTPKPSVASSTVLNILKRFRARRKDTKDSQPPFDERLGGASGPLATRISEISSRIEASRAQAGPDKQEPATEDPSIPNEDDAAPTEADAHPKPRVRAMGFHTPVFPAKVPDEPKDPDFKASTEPPALKLHAAPDGVMENSGAPEKRVTAPKERHAEPLDLKVFAKQLRSSLPKTEAEATPEVEENTHESETEADAAAFKQQFHSRISNASKHLVFDPSTIEEGQTASGMPSGKAGPGLHELAASSALQSWRDFQSSSDQTAADTAIRSLYKPLQTVEDAPPEPVAIQMPEGDSLPVAESAAEVAPDIFSLTGDPGPRSQIGGENFEEEQDPIAGEHRQALSNPAPAGRPEPAAGKQSEPEPETFADVEPDELDTAPGQEHGQEPQTTPDGAPPENIFAALNLDEDEILLRVYDLLQSELQAAWGENITLNIRKLVREEVRAALEKARSGL